MEENANFLQCLAVVEWAMNNREQARQRLEQAKTIIADRGFPSFSCWRYLTVMPSEFLKDCTKLGELIEGKNVRPVMFDADVASVASDNIGV